MFRINPTVLAETARDPYVGKDGEQVTAFELKQTGSGKNKMPEDKKWCVTNNDGSQVHGNLGEMMVIDSNDKAISSLKPAAFKKAYKAWKQAKEEENTEE